MITATPQSSGLQYAVAHQDNFSWAGFAGEVALSSATVIFTFGATYFAGFLTSSVGLELCLAKDTVDLASLESIKRYTRLASTVVGALAETGATSIKKVIKEERVDPVSLVASLVTGALKGFALGGTVADSIISRKMKEMADRILR